jgi:hypothetical protein
MRQIRHVRPRARHDLGVVRDQRVELIGQRLNLGRELSFQMIRPPLANGGQRRAE